VTFRACDTGFDTKVKAAVLGKLINRSPKVAAFVSKRFEIISFVLVIGLTVSTVWTMRGLYLFWAWGSCNGPNSGGFCAFDPAGENNKASTLEEGCVDTSLAAKALQLAPLDYQSYPKVLSGNEHAAQMVFIGCYNCDYTRKAWPVISKLIGEIPTDFYFVHFPVKEETKYLMAYDACIYQQDHKVIWSYIDQRFADTKEDNGNEAVVDAWLENQGVDVALIKQCVASDETQKLVDERYDQIQATGIYGTPTVFINGTAVVGPKPERVYRRLLRGTWF
jgi:protein-disulfide isomerase